MNKKMRKGIPVGLILSVCLCGSVLALTPNAGDPDLALWLKADTGVATSACSEPNQPGAGPCVDSWTDSSSYANVAAAAGGPLKTTLETFTTSGGRTFPVIRIHDTDPNSAYLSIPAPGNPFDDSTNISGDLSLFVVFNPALNGTEGSGFHNIIAKRGSVGSQYSLYLQHALALDVVNGQNPPLGGALGSVFWNAALGAQIMNTNRECMIDTWHITHLRVDVVDQTVEWFDSDTEEYYDALTPIGTEPLDPNIHDILSTDPLGIGNHDQPGVDEPYVGDIAEIILYNRALSDVEATDIANYLYDKYYQPVNCGDLGTDYLPGDLTRDCQVAVDDLSLFFAEWLKCTDPEKPECAPWL